MIENQYIKIPSQIIMKITIIINFIISILIFSAYPQQGSLDETFIPGAGPNSQVRDIVMQPDGKILIVGQFTMYDNVSRQRIARINRDGSLDHSFNPGTGTNAAISSVAVLPDGKILIGGQFTQYNGIERIGVARLNIDGSLDTTFVPTGGINRQLTALAPLPNGKVIIAFSEFRPNLTVNFVYRLNQDGSEDNTFFTGTGTNAGFTRVLVQPDEKILVAGAFTSFNGTTRQRIMRLNQDGTLDTSFNTTSGASDAVWALAIQQDGKIIIGGTFTSYAGNPINRIARLNSNGSYDPTFNPGTGANGQVFVTAVQEDGKILTGGLFNQFNNTPMNFLVRKNPDGSIDQTFNIGSGGNQSVRAIALESSYKILIGGDFTTWNGKSANRLARLIVDDNDDPCASVICPPGFQCFMGTCLILPQTIIVEGVVNDNTTGQPLAGVQVKSVFPYEVSTVTNQQGYYSITVEKNAVIRFEFQGYHKEEVTLGEEDTVVNMVLWSKHDPCYGVVCGPGYSCLGGGCFLSCAEGRWVIGIVTDAKTGLPLENVSAFHGDDGNICFSGRVIGRSDASGLYRANDLYADLSKQTIRFSLNGYYPRQFDVPVGEGDYELNVALLPIDPCDGVICDPGYICFEGGCYLYCNDVLVKGFITDLKTGLPINEVSILNGDDDNRACYSGGRARTDHNGYFESWGSYSETYTTRRLTLIRNGYKTRELFFSGDNIGILNITLERIGEEECQDVECPDGFACFMGHCFPLPQTITLEGQVTSTSTGEPLSGATIRSVFPYEVTATTDARGGYKIDVEKGARVRFEKEGYCSQELMVGDTDIQLDVPMEILGPCCGVICGPAYTCFDGACYLSCGYGRRVKGIVTDAETGLPIENVHASPSPHDICYAGGAFSDASGYYNAIGFVYDLSRQTILFTKTGYHPQEFSVPDGDTDLVLNVALVPIDPCEGVVCSPDYICFNGVCYLNCFSGALVTGIVSDAETGLPLSNVRVSHGGYFDNWCDPSSVLTNASGYFSATGLYMESLLDNQIIIFTREGYERVEIFIGNQPGILNVSMNRLPDVCDDVACGPGKFCLNGTCFFISCSVDFNCPPGFICNQGVCVEDDGPCAEVACPAGMVCYMGSCFKLLNTVTIRGRVTSSFDGFPIAAVMVSSEGSFFISTTTASNGDYTIEAEQGAKLTFSRRGYHSRTFTLGEFSGILNIQLELKDPCEDLVCEPGYICFGGGCFLACTYGRRVTGIVTDAETGLPIENVHASPSPHDICYAGGAFSDASGYYNAIGFVDDLSRQTILFTKAGYHPQEFSVPDGDGVYELNVVLVPIDPCEGISCPFGMICIDGACYFDPCSGIDCPFGYKCDNGTCRPVYSVEALVFPESSGSVAGEGIYFIGDDVTIRANPAAGYRFLSWTQDNLIIGTEKQLTLNNLTENVTVTANFATDIYRVTVETRPFNNLGGIATGAGLYAEGSDVTVNAFPNIDYTFSGWMENGRIISQEQNYSFTINSHRHLTAEFSGASYKINAAASPADKGRITGTGNYYQGDVVFLQAYPDQGYYLLRWMEGSNQVSSQNPYLFTASADRNLIAEFAREWWNDDNMDKSERFMISSTVQPTNQGVVLGQGYYKSGQNVILEAVPNKGVEFAGWLEDGQLLLNQNQQLAGPVLEFTADKNRNIRAMFFSRQYQITVSSNPGNAAITSVSGNGMFFNGEYATISATPKEGYRFKNWTLDTAGGVQFSGRPVTGFTVTRDMNLVANFTELNNFALTLGVFPERAGTVAGAGNYFEGTAASIYAEAATGYRFLYWFSGPELISGKFEDQIFLKSNLHLNAYFELQSFIISASASGGGSINPAGATTVFYGGSIEYIFTPETGYQVADVIVNGQSIGPITSYLFEDISENQTIQVIFEMTTSTVSTFMENLIRIYPNPTRSFITIEFLKEDIGRIEIYLMNINGQIVSEKVTARNESGITLPVDGLSPGIYQLHISGSNLRTTKKIVVTK
jgi:uncharacterized delta-60 repeat protein